MLALIGPQERDGGFLADSLGKPPDVTVEDQVADDHNARMAEPLEPPDQVMPHAPGTPLPRKRRSFLIRWVAPTLRARKPAVRRVGGTHRFCMPVTSGLALHPPTAACRSDTVGCTHPAKASHLVSLQSMIWTSDSSRGKRFRAGVVLGTQDRFLYGLVRARRQRTGPGVGVKAGLRVLGGGRQVTMTLTSSGFSRSREIRDTSSRSFCCERTRLALSNHRQPAHFRR